MFINKKSYNSNPLGNFNSPNFTRSFIVELIQLFIRLHHSLLKKYINSIMKS